MMIILFTPFNAASANIAKRLIAGHGFEQKGEDEWERKGTELIQTSAATVLEVPTEFDTECLVVLSSHKSRKPGKVLTAHIPGNWDKAEMGGKERTLNIAAASRLKIIARHMKEEADRIGWEFTLETDHHGPTCNIPIIFVEIGNGEEEWNDMDAAEAVAGAVAASLEEKEEYETVFGVGGGHYSREFTKLVLETELAVGHIAPKYAIDSLEEDTFRQAIEKNAEKVSKVLISKKETNSSQKNKIISLAGKFRIPYEFI